MTERFTKYNHVLTRLVTEAVACSPQPWRSGTLRIDCDGLAINYSLKNAAEAEKAEISGALRSLCEELYVEMRDNGDVWTEATLSYHQNDDASWGFDVSFSYPEEPAEVSAPRDVPRQPWWKSLMRRMAPVPEWSREPELVVREFIRDYRRWNDGAHAREDYSGESGGRGKSDRITSSEWRKLIDKFCLSGFEGQPIAYGTDSRHDPDREEILSTEAAGDRAAVRTRVRGAPPYEAILSRDYEYELKLDGGRWYLEEVYYVDEEGKYPCL